MVFDASGSMKWDIRLTYAQADQQEQRWLRDHPGKPLPIKPDAHSRITVARKATRSLVEAMPNNVTIGLVLVQKCPKAKVIGFFGPGQREALLQQIDAIKTVSSTPLGDGVRQAAAMVDGVHKDAVIIALSDGRDTCGIDPCSLARKLSWTKPRLRINVVDLQGNGAARCLADETGGRFFAAKSPEEVLRFLKEAAQSGGEDGQDPQCRK